jgi:nucleoside-diphosphate kinase
MEKERTFCMIKPGAVGRNLTGEILSRIEKAGFKIVAMKKMRLSHKLAEKNYLIHKGKSFYDELIAHVTSGPVVAMVLESDGAILKLRELIGATDPSKAKPGTIRADFAESVTKNVIHASDSAETAQREISLFFSPEEIVG